MFFIHNFFVRLFSALAFRCCYLINMYAVHKKLTSFYRWQVTVPIFKIGSFSAFPTRAICCSIVHWANSNRVKCEWDAIHWTQTEFE